MIDSKADKRLNNKVSSNNYTLPKICMDFFNKLYERTSQMAKDNGVYYSLFMLKDWFSDLRECYLT